MGGPPPLVLVPGEGGPLNPTTVPSVPRPALRRGVRGRLPGHNTDVLQVTLLDLMYLRASLKCKLFLPKALKGRYHVLDVVPPAAMYY